MVFLFAKFLITLSKSTCLAMLDSMFNLIFIISVFL